MNIVAYCRVSTDKADQLNSLEAQKAFLRSILSEPGIILYIFMRTRAFRGQKSKTGKSFCG